jgi:hypothetical protein
MSHFKNALVILDLKEVNEGLSSDLNLQQTFTSMAEKKVKRLEAQLKELRERYSKLNEDYAKSEIENLALRDALKQVL